MDADIATLSGFALGEVLSSLDLDESALSSVQSQLGLRGTNKISKDSIYADKFADDDLSDEDDEREDYEAMIDREMREERSGAAKKQQKDGAGPSKQLLRGEEDDFDEDYDEDETMQDGSKLQTQVKAEPADDDDLFGGSDSSSPPPQQTQQEEPMQVENLAAPPPKKVDVKDLFPSFEYGKTLEFTDLFAMRPRKKRRMAKEGVKRKFLPPELFLLHHLTFVVSLVVALPSTAELSRSKSTRDSLSAPLRPLPPPSKGDELVRLLLRDARAEGMRESGAAIGDEEESEGEELRKAVEVRQGIGSSRLNCGAHANILSLLVASLTTDKDDLADTRRRTCFRTCRIRRMGRSDRLGFIESTTASRECLPSLEM
jgi:transcription initiation factor TFIID subunit 1